MLYVFSLTNGWMCEYLSCIGSHAESHQTLQVAAETDSFHCDYGLLGENGAAKTALKANVIWAVFFSVQIKLVV